ncbi:hypothetical protein CY34DRAFT_110420 [Suillus luteus UH-Slu-Lm8-n1]|uniref:Uncharacterized protein n=1 Tax=Suillus luteus UH-Slu-Lm8-n1 TaxID=930992 RepID=A0A0D0AIL2_9AGAM|nr:hypothetical protein CY34DRAFT_110420 [Suillus luteus UH-Slu-Lm8-n1]
MSSPTKSVHSNDSHDRSPVTAKTSLWMSLYVHSVTAPVVNGDTVSSVPSANNPRPLRSMGDSAEYWINLGGQPFTFKFLATLDLDGQYNHSSPYFNLPHTGLDLVVLKKVTLYPWDIPFWRWYPSNENERFSIVVMTDPLVQNIPVPVSKAKAAVMTVGPPGGGRSSARSTNTAPDGLQLADLPDPLGRYAVLITQYSLQECSVVASNICDGQGRIIGPHQYGSQLATGDVVMVECQLKFVTPAKFTNYFSNTKGKRKAVDEPEGSQISKRASEDDNKTDNETDG